MRSSMSGSQAPGGGEHAGDHLLYRDQQPAAGSALSYGNDDELGSVFFRSSASGSADYSSITDYLQGLLDPAGLASHLDAPPTVGHVIGAAAAPVTPNSSTSGEASDELLRRSKGARPPVEGDQGGEVDDEGSTHQHNFRSDTKEKEKKGKGKGKGEKKSRGSRVAFATKSEVDHLDDGYRWRKYGQKAVKNSSFPRSYYRCTAAQCGVKKLVERSQQDPSTVVTTYEGRHAHPSPVATHRSAHMLMGIASTDIYSSTALRHHQYGFCPADADTYAHMCMQPTTMTHQLSEYGGMQLHADVLPGAVIGYQQGHR